MACADLHTHVPLGSVAPAKTSCRVALHLRVRSEKTSSALFFKYNAQLGPPYQVLVDTNFINFAIKNKACVLHTCPKIMPLPLISLSSSHLFHPNIHLMTFPNAQPTNEVAASTASLLTA